MTETGLQGVVSRNVRVLMAVRGIETQKELAAKVGWIETKLTKSFRGDRKWSLEDLPVLADALGVTPGELLGEVGGLIGALSPARTGTDVVSDRVTWKYRSGNDARVIQFPQVRVQPRGYRSRKGRVTARYATVLRDPGHSIAEPVA
jgi:hypothetical protein